jgi:hypothetical protein
MTEPTPGVRPGEMLLTVFLKHRQSMNLAEINQKLEDTGFWREFPPDSVEVVSWYVMMGIGQVVTLKLPAEKLRAVNLAIEQNAWGAFETEFYPTYDFPPGVAGDQGTLVTHLVPLSAARRTDRRLIGVALRPRERSLRESR